MTGTLTERTNSRSAVLHFDLPTDAELLARREIAEIQVAFTRPNPGRTPSAQADGRMGDGSVHIGRMLITAALYDIGAAVLLVERLLGEMSVAHVIVLLSGASPDGPFALPEDLLRQRVTVLWAGDPDGWLWSVDGNGPCAPAGGAGSEAVLVRALSDPAVFDAVAPLVGGVWSPGIAFAKIDPSHPLRLAHAEEAAVLRLTTADPASRREDLARSLSVRFTGLLGDVSPPVAAIGEDGPVGAALAEARAAAATATRATANLRLRPLPLARPAETTAAVTRAGEATLALRRVVTDLLDDLGGDGGPGPLTRRFLVDQGLGGPGRPPGPAQVTATTEAVAGAATAQLAERHALPAVAGQLRRLGTCLRPRQPAVLKMELRLAGPPDNAGRWGHPPPFATSVLRSALRRLRIAILPAAAAGAIAVVLSQPARVGLLAAGTTLAVAVVWLTVRRWSAAVDDWAIGAGVAEIAGAVDRIGLLLADAAANDWALATERNLLADAADSLATTCERATDQMRDAPAMVATPGSEEQPPTPADPRIGRLSLSALDELACHDHLDLATLLIDAWGIAVSTDQAALPEAALTAYAAVVAQYRQAIAVAGLVVRPPHTTLSDEQREDHLAALWSQASVDLDHLGSLGARSPLTQLCRPIDTLRLARDPSGATLIRFAPRAISHCLGPETVAAGDHGLAGVLRLVPIRDEVLDIIRTRPAPKPNAYRRV